MKSIFTYPLIVDPLTSDRLAEIEGELAKRLDQRVEQAFVFGSCGTTDQRLESDIDLILISETCSPNFVNRALLFEDLFDVFSRLDILVYKRAEFSSLINSDNGFWRGVARQIRPLRGLSPIQ